jgi:hypothetical protein
VKADGHVSVQRAAGVPAHLAMQPTPYAWVIDLRFFALSGRLWEVIPLMEPMLHALDCCCLLVEL